MSHRRIMKSETVQRRVSKDIFCASSYLLSKLIRDPKCASMRLIVLRRATFALLLSSAIQPSAATTLSYADGARANAGGSGTPPSNFSASSNNDCSPEPVRSQEYQKLVRFLIITKIIVFSFSISQPIFGTSGTWPLCVGICEANNISDLNAKFDIINHSKDRQNLLSIKLDINCLHKECRGSMLPGFEVCEFS